MATKKFNELQNFSDEELINELKETKTEFDSLKFDHTVTGLENPLRIRMMRRDIARLNTEIRRRELVNYTEEQLNKRDKIRLRRKLKNK
ncbi:MAG: 50S ribosomal protein L29 [Saprospiraceae bacterium]